MPSLAQKQQAVSSIPVSYFSVVRDSLERAVLTGGMLFGIFIGATAFSLVLRPFGGDSVITGLAESSGLGTWGILAALMAEIFLLGFSFDWIEIALIVLRIFVPIVELLDFDGHVSKAEVLYWLAILMAINLQTSFLTPPFGFTLFYVKGAAPFVVSMQEIWRGSMPFVGLQLIALALVMALSDIALWLPRTYLN